MNRSNNAMQLVMSNEPNAVSEAALIWALAKAQRDRHPAPTTGEEAIQGVQNRLNMQGAKMLLARREDTFVGFTLFAPREESLEIFYLAVDPECWGGGAARDLLKGAEDYARSIGHSTLELWVINDNERAISVYERFGFVGTDQVKYDESSNKTERRMLKQIGIDTHSAKQASKRSENRAANDSLQQL